MTKMDMVWVATAHLLHPRTAPTATVSREEIESEAQRLFGAALDIPRVLIDKHLVSFEDRQADRTIPERGGSRNRYLFRTEDGHNPSRQGRFRLYRQSDSTHDGTDKTGPVHPDAAKIEDQFHNLISWYENSYL